MLVRNKSKKLAKLEKQRFSILTDEMSVCYVCKRSPVDMHEIYGGGNRQMSMKNGFCVPLCRTHHNLVKQDKKFDYYLKWTCQREFEKTHTREEFMKKVGRNYEL